LNVAATFKQNEPHLPACFAGNQNNRRLGQNNSIGYTSTPEMSIGMNRDYNEFFTI